MDFQNFIAGALSIFIISFVIIRCKNSSKFNKEHPEPQESGYKHARWKESKLEFDITNMLKALVCTVVFLSASAIVNSDGEEIKREVYEWQAEREIDAERATRERDMQKALARQRVLEKGY